MAKCFVHPKSGKRYFPFWTADGEPRIGPDGTISVTGERDGRRFGPPRVIRPENFRVEDHPRPTNYKVQEQQR